MKLATAMVNGQEDVLWVANEGYVALSQLRAAYGGKNTPITMARLLADGELLNECRSLTQKAVQDGRIQKASAERLLAPVPHPGKILCVGLNYRPHARESQMEIPSHPVLFNKYANAVCGSGDAIHAPFDAKELDYEAELVIIMGKSCSQVSEEDALGYVFGYCNGNDVSARDLQFRTGQWLLGKACDQFAPMGPYVVTADELTDPDNLEIRGLRNGKVVQNANTRDMIFSCRYLISYISRYMTLEPGDVIFTGTPEGVILGKSPAERDWLQAGEHFAVNIEGLGTLDNEIGASRSML